MRSHFPRKTAPKVCDGKVQRKNRTALSPGLWQGEIALTIRRLPAGGGYRHVVTRQHVERFLRLLPDRDELIRGLRAIVLGPGDPFIDGSHLAGVVRLCAWPRDLVVKWSSEYFAAHREVLEMLRVPWKPCADGWMECHFDERTARGFQLLHILLHELGHHHDRITSRNGRWSVRGESYAEEYALRQGAIVWKRYRNEFGPPERRDTPAF